MPQALNFELMLVQQIDLLSKTPDFNVIPEYCASHYFNNFFYLKRLQQA